MKRLIKGIIYILFLGLITSACSEEEIVNGNGLVEEGTPVVLDLPYNVSTPKTVSRATEAEEYKLYDLQIFIFNKDGKLKGYKKIESGLAEGGNVGSTSIKTTVGESYIYAVANATSSLYSAEGIPADLNEDDAQAGNETFTLEDLKGLLFQRGNGIDITSGKFLMTGTANGGRLCTITKSGISNPTSAEEKRINLRRIVSKVKFVFNHAANTDFIIKRYSIYNLPKKGYLIDGGVEKPTSDITDNSYDNELDMQNFSQDAKNEINVYLPENNESVKRLAAASDQPQREANKYSGETKTFTNAPANSTYIVVSGEFTRTNTTTGRVDRYADVDYTIHLGDFDAEHLDNYDNERNCTYAYTATINDVNNIITEVTTDKKEDPQPGAEGFVVDYTYGKNFLLDSHYEVCVMQFKQEDIQKLISQNKGYIFQLETIDGLSDSYTVDSEWNDSKLPENLDYKWVTLYKGGNYNEKDDRGGAPTFTYTSTSARVGYTVPQLLKYLYDNAYVDNAWTNGTLTYTCFVDENYYPTRKWSDYVNKNPRVLYIANDVQMSSDKHSVYATLAYGVKQRSIQTFYNKDRASDPNFIAYGCETIDETTPTPNQYEKGHTYSSGWDGRNTMMQEVYSMTGIGSNAWGTATTANNLKRAAVACMSRNRDLNKDGKITQDEVRWYLPSYAQYSGLWLGEKSIATEAALFTGLTTDMILDGNNNAVRRHYFTNTNQRETFWAEEGSTFGAGGDKAYINYVRCVRNLQSGATGVENQGEVIAIPTTKIAKEYYTFKDNTFTLDDMDKAALRQNPQLDEFGNHHERDNAINAPYRSFTVDTQDITEGVTIDGVVNGTSNCKSRREATGENWRVPNQREMNFMVIENLLTVKGENNKEAIGTYCRTSYSNPEYRFTYGFTSYFRLYSMQGGPKGYHNQPGKIRCVRDN